jgi:hypothetical protein
MLDCPANRKTSMGGRVAGDAACARKAIAPAPKTAARGPRFFARHQVNNRTLIAPTFRRWRAGGDLKPRLASAAGGGVFT